jgi:hypothetical protein
VSYAGCRARCREPAFQAAPRGTPSARQSVMWRAHQPGGTNVTELTHCDNVRGANIPVLQGGTVARFGRRGCGNPYQREAPKLQLG